jgi:hemolysin activation/secretion protein
LAFHHYFLQSMTTLFWLLLALPALPAIAAASQAAIEPTAPGSAAGESDVATVDVPTMRVQALHLRGNSHFDSRVLLQQTGFAPDSDLDLTQLQQMAQAVEDFYHAHGYFLARAFLPPIEEGADSVTISVLEGRYGKLTVQNQTDLAADRLAWLLRELQAGQLAQLAPLERTLLLLGEVPGVTAKATFAAGAAQGQTELILTLNTKAKWLGSIELDRNGSPNTGRQRWGASLAINNLSGQGDQLGVRLLDSFRGLQNGRIAWQMPLQAVQAGLAYDVTDYSLGRDFASLGVNGTARDWNLSFSTSLYRTRQTSLTLQWGMERKKLHDRIDSLDSVNDKATTLWNLGLNGLWQDAREDDGSSAFNLNLAKGRLYALQARETGFDGFYKFNYSLSHSFYKAFGHCNLSFLLSGQRASGSLDPSEKMTLGGASGVRAWSADEASGDQGDLFSAELRRDWPGMTGNWRLLAFVDIGQSGNKDSDARLQRRLRGAGMGVHWEKPGSFSVKLEYAHKLGQDSAAGDEQRKGRIWLAGSKLF